MTTTTVGSSVAKHRGHLTTTMLVDSIPGLTYRQLDYWTRAGHVIPDGEPTPGSGYARCWSPEEAAVVRRITALLAIGFMLPAAIRYARLGVGCHELGPDIFLEVGP